MKHPKTTVMGLLSILVALGNAAVNILGGHPVDWNATATAVMAGIGLITAADGGK